MDQSKSLKDIIIERADSKGLSAEKLFNLTGIPRHYLNALLKEEYHKLPAAPYVRGYLQKLSAALDLDGRELWDLHRFEIDPKSSGAADKLPENRFVIKTKKVQWSWIGAAVIVVGLYLLLNADRLLGLPDIRILNPESETSLVSASLFTVNGYADPKDKILINEEEVYVDQSGKFQKSYTLQPGLNTLEVTAKRFLGKETKIIRQIIYQPQ